MLSTVMYTIYIFQGVQVLLCNYDFSSKRTPTFNEEHIMNIFPIVKHINPKVRVLQLLFKPLTDEQVF